MYTLCTCTTCVYVHDCTLYMCVCMYTAWIAFVMIVDCAEVVGCHCDSGQCSSHEYVSGNWVRLAL